MGMNVSDMANFGLNSANDSVVIRYDDYLTPESLYRVPDDGGQAQTLETRVSLFDPLGWSPSRNRREALTAQKCLTSFFVRRI